VSRIRPLQDGVAQSTEIIEYLAKMLVSVVLGDVALVCVYMHSLFRRVVRTSSHNEVCLLQDVMVTTASLRNVEAKSSARRRGF
jgi:hypothetical protein